MSQFVLFIECVSFQVLIENIRIQRNSSDIDAALEIH